uniref:Cytochrome b5 heme-binding domain-containing protein n=1 Tax=Eptatretus burgeri TaxID=7764 RepID=A0A8C4QRX1_EPTBU
MAERNAQQRIESKEQERENGAEKGRQCKSRKNREEWNKMRIQRKGEEREKSELQDVKEDETEKHRERTQVEQCGKEKEEWKGLSKNGRDQRNGTREGGKESPCSLFTREEVRVHSTIHNAWITLHRCVYDVTKFLVQHPGGEAVLLDRVGQDASAAFEMEGHSPEARELAKQFFIGELHPDEQQAEEPLKAPQIPPFTENDSQQSFLQCLGLAVTVLVLAILAGMLLFF